MKVKLNSIIYDLDGNVISKVKIIDAKRVEVALKFSSLLYEKISTIKSTVSSEIKTYFNIMTKMHEIMTSMDNDIISELSQDEFDICLKLLDNENLIIRARFLESIVEE